MTEDRSAPGASSTSHPRPSRNSSRSDAASSTSSSPGSTSVRARIEAFGVRPSKALGQNFLLDANLAAAIVRDAGVSAETPVLEIGAGTGALTTALAAAGAPRVVAVEFDRALLPALRDAVGRRPGVEIVHGDATKLAWTSLLDGDAWLAVGNLPYNVGTTIVVDLLERAPMVARIVAMLQREVAQRLVATPAEREAYGAMSVRVAYRAHAEVLRHVPPTVFWPQPSVGSAIVRLDRRAAPPVEVDEAALWRVVDESFGHRRKTMRNAVRRLGFDAAGADGVLASAAIDPRARPETLDLDAFARVAAAVA